MLVTQRHHFHADITDRLGTCFPWWTFGVYQHCTVTKKVFGADPQTFFVCFFSILFVVTRAGEVYVTPFTTHIGRPRRKGAPDLLIKTQLQHSTDSLRNLDRRFYIGAILNNVCFIGMMSWLLSSERYLWRTVKTKLCGWEGDDMVGGNVVCSVNSSSK